VPASQPSRSPPQPRAHRRRSGSRQRRCRSPPRRPVSTVPSVRRPPASRSRVPRRESQAPHLSKAKPQPPSRSPPQPQVCLGQPVRPPLPSGSRPPPAGFPGH
jgi:hypothetical protein